MTALRCSPALLRAAVAANAVACPLPPHHRTARAILAHGERLLSQGERWFVDSVLRLSAISERQQARLNELAVKVERNR
jgi:hypothetical protein